MTCFHPGNETNFDNGRGCGEAWEAAAAGRRCGADLRHVAQFVADERHCIIVEWSHHHSSDLTWGSWHTCWNRATSTYVASALM